MHNCIILYRLKTVYDPINATLNCNYCYNLINGMKRVKSMIIGIPLAIILDIFFEEFIELYFNESRVHYIILMI